MKTKSIHGASPSEINAALELSMEDGFRPSLAFVFMSIQLDRKAVCAIFDETNITIFGATTAGEFTDKGIEKGTAAILLLEINPDCYKIVFEEFKDQSLKEVGQNIAQLGKTTFAEPAYIISASNLATMYEYLVEGFLAVLGQEAKLIGGNAGDDFLFEGSYVFSNTQYSTKGILTLIIDQSKVKVEGRAVSGWKPVGTSKKITHSEENWVYTIDDKPALDVVMKYTGVEVNMENDKEVKIIGLGESFPFQVKAENGSTVMKPPMMCNLDTRAIMCGGCVPQGSDIYFSLPPDFDVVDTVIQSAEKLKTDSLPEVDAMIIFSCCGRLGAFGPLIDNEINGLAEVWKVPMAGFFTYGEYGTTESGVADFHGTTCSWVVFKEK